MDSSSSPSVTTHPVEFTGKGGEFFGIWIVNLLLSVITLGIYSAWAKVRTNQYFYGHTSINGHSFRYLAKPLQILRGRIIAFLLFVGFSVASNVSPIAGALMTLFFLAAIPWIIVQGIKFNMRMTSYRNVRFSFTGDYGGAFLHFILLPIVGVFTLYLAFPWVLKRIDQFLMSNTTYGGRQLRFENRTGQYYLAAVAAVGTGVLVALLLVFIVGLFGVSVANFAQSGGQVMGAGMIATTIVIMLIYWVGFTLVTAVYQSMIRNHILQSAEIDEVATFNSSMHPVSFTVLMLTNTLIILCTLGFGYPIAKVRKMAYLASATEVNIDAKAASVIDSVSDETNAFGEEAAGFFDIDLSLT